MTMKSIISTAVIFPIAFIIITSLARFTKDLYDELNHPELNSNIHQLNHCNLKDTCLYNASILEIPELH